MCSGLPPPTTPLSLLGEQEQFSLIGSLLGKYRIGGGQSVQQFKGSSVLPFSLCDYLDYYLHFILLNHSLHLHPRRTTKPNFLV